MVELLLETATEVCSVAIAIDGKLVAEITAPEPYQHASHLTLFIRQVLTDAGMKTTDLDGVVISDGPGSYTSLRVGAATAKGLCVALPNLQLFALPTLFALARAAGPFEAEDKILATIDSRRGEVFGQVFTATDLSPLSEVMNVRLTEQDWRGRLLAGAGLGHIMVCGPGQHRLREELPPEDNAFTFGPPLQCSARFLLSAGGHALLRDVAGYEPLYLNPPFVTKSKKKALL